MKTENLTRFLFFVLFPSTGTSKVRTPPQTPPGSPFQIRGASVHTNLPSPQQNDLNAIDCDFLDDDTWPGISENSEGRFVLNNEVRKLVKDFLSESFIVLSGSLTNNLTVNIWLAAQFELAQISISLSRGTFCVCNCNILQAYSDESKITKVIPGSTDPITLLVERTSVAPLIAPFWKDAPRIATVF